MFEMSTAWTPGFCPGSQPILVLSRRRKHTNRTVRQLLPGDTVFNREARDAFQGESEGS